MVRKIYRDISVKSFRCATQHRKIIIFISHKYLCDCLHQLVRPNREQYIDIDDKIRIEGSTIQNRLLGHNQLSALKLFTISIIDSNYSKVHAQWSGGKSGESQSILTQSAVLSIVWRCWVQWPVIIFSTQSYSFISDFLLLLRLFKSKTILYH